MARLLIESDILDNNGKVKDEILPNVSSPDEAWDVTIDGDGNQQVMPKASYFLAILLPVSNAPINGVVDDIANTFNFTYGTGSSTIITDYEYSINEGASWTDATAKPIVIGDGNFGIGAVQVRVKAIPTVSNASAILSNTVAFTEAPGATPFILTQNIPASQVVGDYYRGGFQFYVGSQSITVTHVGRWCFPGDSHVHMLEITGGSGSSIGGNYQAYIDLNGKPANQYAYVALPAPVVLEANTWYRCYSEENGAGDAVVNADATVTHTDVASEIRPSYNIIGLNSNGSYDHILIPVNFKYTL